MPGDKQSYVTASFILSMDERVKDVKVSLYTMEVTVEEGEFNESLVDYLEGEGWNYTGHYTPKPATKTIDIYTFEA